MYALLSKYTWTFLSMNLECALATFDRVYSNSRAIFVTFIFATDEGLTLHCDLDSCPHMCVSRWVVASVRSAPGTCLDSQVSSETREQLVTVCLVGEERDEGREPRGHLLSKRIFRGRNSKLEDDSIRKVVFWQRSSVCPDDGQTVRIGDEW